MCSDSPAETWTVENHTYCYVHIVLCVWNGNLPYEFCLIDRITTNLGLSAVLMESPSLSCGKPATIYASPSTTAPSNAETSVSVCLMLPKPFSENRELQMSSNVAFNCSKHMTFGFPFLQAPWCTSCLMTVLGDSLSFTWRRWSCLWWWPVPRAESGSVT